MTRRGKMPVLLSRKLRNRCKFPIRFHATDVGQLPRHVGFDDLHQLNKLWPNLLFGLGAIFIAAAPFVFRIFENPPEWTATIFVVSGFSLALLSRFDDIKEFAVFGLSA